VKEKITPQMQERISTRHFSRCSLAIELTHEAINPESGKDYSFDDIVKGYLYRNEIISNDDYVLMKQMIGYEKSKEYLHDLSPKKTL